MIRTLAYLSLAALLVACAAPQSEAPRAAAPKPAEPRPAYVATTQTDGVVRVKGPAKHEDDLAAHHCTAAKIAKAQGAATVEWVGGVAKPAAEGLEADMAYEFGADATKARWSDPERGGPVKTIDWLQFCDKAGIPRGSPA